MSSSLLARTIVATLIAQGVEHVVLAPGSRNAPLSIALSVADKANQLRLQVVLDERSAGFMALGLAKASGRVVAVVTTSGTAVANLAPAILEASHSSIGLLAITADRPVSMRDSGANQTTRQPGIFGDAVRDATIVSSESGDENAWRFALTRAHALAAGTRTRNPGPVHVNVELAAPLVDDSLLQPIIPVTLTTISATRPAEPLVIAADDQTVVLVGDASPELGRKARALAELAGLPLFAEPSSNARFGSNAIADYAEQLKGEARRSEIRRVLMFGHPTLSRPVNTLLGQAEVIAATDTAKWIDPGHRVTAVCDSLEVEGAASPDWLQLWQSDSASNDDQRVRLASAVLENIPPASNLVLGSSAMIRAFDRAPIIEHGALVWANRGLAGIDGTIATARGIALATGEPTTVVLGDLSFQHDLGSLIAGSLEPEVNLRIVIADDAGGAIFASLEQGDDAYSEHFERVFATPQQVDLSAMATGFGATLTTCDLSDALKAALSQPIAGLEIVIVKLSR